MQAPGAIIPATSKMFSASTENAFLRNDEARRREYLASLQKGETKINASVAQPHEIVSKYTVGHWSRTVKKYDIALEEMWKALPNICVENSLVVRDGSGSMTTAIGNGKTTCLDVATALAIYCAEHNSDVWKDKQHTLNNLWVKEKIIRDIRKYFELTNKIATAHNS